MLWKQISVIGLTVLVLGGGPATASAVEEELLLFGGQNGAIEGKASTLTVLGNAFSIECKNSKGKLEAVNGSETFKGEIEFAGCTGTGLGLPAGVIKFKFKGLLCLWGATNLELRPCAFVETSENVHVEVPLIGLLDFLVGSSQAGKLEPDGVLVKELTAKFEKGAVPGAQLLPEVKDLGATLKPEIKILQNHAGEEKHGALASTFTITYAAAGTLDA
jgi:hypothetical protein